MTDTLQRIAVIAASVNGVRTGARLAEALRDSAECRVALFSPREAPEAEHIVSTGEFVRREFQRWDAFVFIGALGICVRSIAPVLGDKQSDPAVVNCDEKGAFVQSVLSGHRGGANELAARVARLLGALPVITTSSDVQGLWALDILGRREEWACEYRSARGGKRFNDAVAAFVNREPTALLLDIRDEGTDRLERECPEFVTVVRDYDEIDFSRYSLLLCVSPHLYEPPVQAVFYRPKVLSAGLGSEKGIDPERFVESFLRELRAQGLSHRSVGSLGSVDFKMEEPAFRLLAEKLGVPLQGFRPEELESIDEVPNPSETVFRKVGVHSVSEAASALLSGGRQWLVEKRKVALQGVLAGNPRHYTFAISVDNGALRTGFVSIVGAGPGDPGLVTKKGLERIEQADLVLYAGSLVPEKLTRPAKPGALVRSSASLSLEEQFELMGSFYRRGLRIVRLHTGDPSIYGAIQEQIAWFEANGMAYEIVPGVSSFQAAAAVLASQFTIPEKVQTIILTRGNGRTPVPEKERLGDLARAQATMCIYLSAEWAEEVQKELEEHYPASTPVAVCYRLTWDDQQVWRGELQNLAALVKESGKTRTVLLVVGEAIGARVNRSKLYDPRFSHGFRSADGEGRGT